MVDSHIFAKTERLLLRPLRLEDAEDVVLMRKDPEVMKHTYVISRDPLFCLVLINSRSILPNDDLEKTEQWIQGTLCQAAAYSNLTNMSRLS